MRMSVIRHIAAALILSTMGAVFPAKAGEAGLPANLVGTAWLVDGMDGGGVVDRARSTMEFTKAGQVAGMAGCNRYFGSVSIDGETVSFGNLATTRKMCPDARMDQEQRFLKALSAAKRLTLAHEGLVFVIYADGPEPVLRFSKILDK